MSRRATRRLLGAAAAAAALAAIPAAAQDVIRVGSKGFTESYILAEIVAQVIERAGEARAERHFGLGGTGIVDRAIATGAIDVYPEYAGTLARVILKDPALRTPAEIRERLAARGLTLSGPLGFANTYALAVREDTARRLGLGSISDLARHPGLRGAFSSGFLERPDGWPGLARHYGLALRETRVMEHALTYRALAAGEVDVIDVFSTDGQLERLRLRLLADDRGFFPDYAAVLVARRAMVDRHPRTWARLEATLAGRLDHRRMAQLNAMADLDRVPVPEVAARFLGEGRRGAPARRRLLDELAPLTLDHLLLVGASVGVAALLGIPLGILAARRKRLGQAELALIGMLQTVPALALLVFMIPLLGIGKMPALVALTLYALLPIARTTYAGLAAIDRQLLDVAVVLGLGGLRRLCRVELPLASIGIMAGIKTSAVMTVGTATLAAFIGGGGYGTLIVRGLALDDVETILAGAVPAALMAVAFHLLFEGVDRLVVPRGLRRATGVGP